MEMNFFKKPKPFEIKCKTHDIYFGDKTESTQKLKRCYFIEVITSFTNDYMNDEIFVQKDFIYFKSENDDDAKIMIYYPYDFPALVKLIDWVDTYTGVVDMVAVNRKGWVTLNTHRCGCTLESKYDKSPIGILDNNDHYRSIRERCLNITDDNYNAICKAVERVKDADEALAEKLNSIALKLKFQKD